MNFPDIFRSFFGLNRNQHDSSDSHLRNDFRNPIWNIDDDDDTDDELHHNFDGSEGNGNFPSGFHIFTNPLEMHRYFEQQMNEILKSFGGMMGQDSGINFPLPNGIPQFTMPSIMEKKEGNIRDEYLKPGYHSANSSKGDNSDSDLDGKITSEDLNSFFKNDENSSQVATFSPQRPNNPSFFGQTIIRRSITLPDGNIETTQTIKTSDGREETTVTVSPSRGFHNEGGSVQPFNDMWKSFFGL